MLRTRAPCAATAAAAVSLALVLAEAPAGAQAPAPPAKTAKARPTVAAVQGDPSRARRSHGGVSLPRCLKLAEQNHPDLLVARAKVRKVRAQVIEAYAAPYLSSFRAFGGMSLAPTVRGNNVYSPNTDVSLTSSLGVAWRVGVDGVLPLWTFGKITNLWDAAAANVKVHEADVEVTRDSIRFDVRKAYFGLQLARDGLALLDEAQSTLDEAVAKLQKKVDEEEGDPIDLLKIQTFAATLQVRRAEAERFARVALAGLRFYTGKKRLDILDLPIKPAKHRLGKLSRYLTAAGLHRPDVHKVRAGIEAREAQVRMSRSGLFPDIALAMSAGLSAAPEVANQINPFVADPGNYFHYGLALVAQWRLDFVSQGARIEQAEADLDEMLALDRKASSGVAVEVEEAYATVVDWSKRLQAYRQAAKLAKRWLVTVEQSVEIGALEEDEIVDPAKTYAEHRFNVLNATMEYNLAMSQLAKVTGWDGIAPDGR